MTMATIMSDTAIADVRAFNRFYTSQIGLLDEHFADGPLSLAEARVLYEIDARGHTTARELIKALRIDRGYLSRMLRKFGDADLTAMSPILGDRRSNQIALTTDGDVIVDRLNQKSDQAVESMLHPLDASQRAELTAAMATIRRLLGDAPTDAPVVLRPHRLGELGWLIHRQGLLYNQQFGWNGEFETLIARIYHEYEVAPETPPKALWVAERAGRVVGSIFVLPSEGREGTAQLRMLYVEPEARGLGLGATLVTQVVDFARKSGYRRVRLWTQSALVSARRIYEAAGFRCVETNEHHSFGKDLTGEHWELEL
jgi:DNA-binding MarR family transcriptional regulator/N-acetylglutamate synthase-like GNAT family acetyltransferase